MVGIFMGSKAEHQVTQIVVRADGGNGGNGGITQKMTPQCATHCIICSNINC